MAVDITRTQSVQIKMQNAADAAALAARLELDTNPGGWKKTAKETFDENSINVNFSGNPRVVATNPQPDVVKVVVNGNLKPHFAQIFGYPNLAVSVESVVHHSQGSPYLSVVFLIDHSNSMGVGATDHAISKMASASGCAFSCHYKDSGINETYTRNASTGARTRICLLYTSDAADD